MFYDLQVLIVNLCYRVVAIDQRGYGDSDKPDGVDSYAIEKLCQDLRQLIRALGKYSFWV